MQAQILKVERPSLEELRRLIGANSDEPGARSSFSLYPDGLAAGCLIELAGEGKTEWVARFLKEHPEFKTAWLEETLTVYPYGLLQKGLLLKNILFIEAEKDMAWSLTQVLASGCFQVVLLRGEKWAEKDLRRAQLLAEKSGAHLFLLSEELQKSWVPSLQLRVSRGVAGLEWIVHRKRGAG